ncbi:hypothetical protein HPULCUR_011788 [Helicostylum pulchrum]|uniref:C2H2-type domain-containing protein n=1 Tax=Helicostylum pulchrum TaxID=562976 RepID=A0ABP9YI07_9FUNG
MSSKSPKNLTVDTIDDNTAKVLIALHHGCYICGQFYRTPSTALNHVRTVHGRDIPGRGRGKARPIKKCYQYVMRMDTDDFDEAHYSRPSCWFHCPLNEIVLFQDHTIKEHNPKPITIGSDDEYGTKKGTKSRRKKPASLPRGRPSSSSSNYSFSSNIDYLIFSDDEEDPIIRPITQEYIISSDEEEEEVAIIRPSSHQSRILDDPKDISGISEDRKSELYQKIDELVDLFNAIFRR